MHAQNSPHFGEFILNTSSYTFLFALDSGKFNTIASLSSSSNSQSARGGRLGLTAATAFDFDTNSQVDALNDSFNNSINSGLRRGAALYIICEKSQAKSLRANEKDNSQIAFVPVEVHEVKDTKNSFKKLCRACVPSSAGGEMTEVQPPKPGRRPSKPSSAQTFTTNIDYQENAASQEQGAKAIAGFHKQIHDSKWFEQLQLILTVTSQVVDRIEEAASVIVALEEGWDLTAQVVSLAELLMDPYYRTLDGFSALIEREWLSMGHRFTRRNNHTVDDQTGFAPVFIQFLDAVHQCQAQFPGAFEFNEFYLEFLAYHSVSNRFKTFLLDSEFERANHGLLTFTARDDVAGVDPLRTNVSYATASAISANTTCIWQYILRVHFHSAKFFNFNYQPGAWQTLRPSASVYKLKLWRYYIKETLCTGPVYDLDIASIYDLNGSRTASSSGPDEFWYPVPLKNAGDYYEQLDEIVPSQYEVLLKQIMRKYKLGEGVCLAHSSPQPPSPTRPSSLAGSFSTTALLNSLLLNNGSNTPNAGAPIVQLNWKNIWDYFYQLVSLYLASSCSCSGSFSFNNINCMF